MEWRIHHVHGIDGGLVHESAAVAEAFAFGAFVVVAVAIEVVVATVVAGIVVEPE